MEFLQKKSVKSVPEMKKSINLLKILNKKEKLLLLFVFIISFIVMAFEMIGVTIIPLILTKILNIGNLNDLQKIPSFANNFFTNVNTNFFLILFLIVIFFAKALINYLHFVIEYISIKRIRIRLTNKWFEETINQDFLKVQKTPVSHKIWSANLIETTAGIISNYLNFFKGLIVCISIFIIVIFFSPGKLIIFYLSILLLILLFYAIFSKKISNYGKFTALALREKISVIQSTFTGIKNIIIYGKKFFFIKKLINKNIDKEKNQQANAFVGNLPGYFLEFIGVLIICIYIYILLQQSISQSELIFNVGIVVYGSFRILSYFKVITQNFSLIKARQFDVQAILDQFKYFQNRKKISQSKNHNYNVDMQQEISLEIKNIIFSYNNQKLLNIGNYKFKKNTFYIIIGDSGSGKSTLLDLMLNIIKPNSGTFNYSTLQDKIGYVSQECFVLNDSIKKNIAFAQQENEINDERIKKVIKSSNLEKFVSDQYQKEQFLIENNGSNISIGQKQRIGIARALYYQPDIIFLDEPTSSLDEENETLILKTLFELKKNSTIIMVTHNFKNLTNYDKLLELKNGELIEKN